MKTIKQLQNEEDWSFLFNVVLLDFFRIIWVYLVIYLLAKLFL